MLPQPETAPGHGDTSLDDGTKLADGSAGCTAPPVGCTARQINTPVTQTLNRLERMAFMASNPLSTELFVEVLMAVALVVGHSPNEWVPDKNKKPPQVRWETLFWRGNHRLTAWTTSKTRSCQGRPAHSSLPCGRACNYQYKAEVGKHKDSVRSQGQTFEVFAKQTSKVFGIV